MLKLNKKGFALVETLIVSVVVMTIFTILYTNFYPMMGEYSKRENYDDIDSIYNTYLIKTLLENSKSKGFEFAAMKNNIDSNGINRIFHADFDKDSINSFKKDTEYCKNLTPNIEGENLTNYCINLLFETKAINVYLTKYNLTPLKKNISEIENNIMDEYTKDYIDTLPYYSKVENSNGYTYRIIVEYVKEINKESEKSRKEIYSFSTMGVEL